MYVMFPELPESETVTIENSLIELSMFLVAVAFGDDAFVCLGIRIFDISAARFC